MTLDPIFLDYMAKGYILSGDGDGYLVMPHTPDDIRQKIEEVNQFYFEMYGEYLFKYYNQ